MMGWLFGGSNAADKTIDNIASGVDKFFYTDEEKSEAGQKGFELFIEYQKATQPQNVARRMIAMIITLLFAGLLLLAVIVWPFNVDYAIFIIKDVVLTIVLPVYLTINTFYFAKRFIGGKSG